MATAISTIITNARTKYLRETTARFWTDAELFQHALTGIADLWRMLIDLHKDHKLTIDDTNVTLAANSSQLSGIPANCFRLISIEARDQGDDSDNVGLEFFPRDWNHSDAVNARRQSAVDPHDTNIYYTVTGDGPPVDTLVVRVAPQVTSTVNLTIAYVKTHGVTASGDNNPIPGESDLALEAWITAHARAKEREDGSPDPDMLAIYANEKQNIQVANTPRQEQELATVEGMFEGY